MKRSIICLFLTLSFTVMTVSPFMTLHAANLWNKKSGAGKSSGRAPFYNQQKGGKKKGPLYNTPRSSDKHAYGSKGLRKSIEGYARVEYAQVVPSKLDGLVSPSTLRNRNNDLNYTLGREHEMRKANASTMIKRLRANERIKRKNKAEAASNRRLYHENPAAYKIKKIKDNKKKKRQMNAMLSSKEARQMAASRKKKSEKRKVLQQQRMLVSDTARASEKKVKSSATLRKSSSSLYNRN